MQIKAQGIVINQDDPFANDTLSRQEEIENLSTLVLNIDTPNVLAINSRWGTGKTSFIKMWEAYLLKKSVPAFYFNAWSTDFVDDPLVAFLGGMNESLLQRFNTAQLEDKWNKTKAVGSKIAKRALPAVVKVATAGIIDPNDFAGEAAADVLHDLSGDAVEAFEKHKSEINEFKKLLIELVAEQAPIVIFIDELDRCRPDYAIALLERVKHLFDVEGLLFVLAVDKTQLSSSLKSIHGSDMDTNGYLKRFIDFEYSMKAPSVPCFIDGLLKNNSIADDFLQSRANRPDFTHELDYLKNTLEIMAEAYNLSLRDIEKFFTKIILAILSTPSNQPLYPAVLCYLVVLKEYDYQIYQNYRVPDSDPSDIVWNLRAKAPFDKRFSTIELADIEATLIAARYSRNSLHSSDRKPQILKSIEEIIEAGYKDNNRHECRYCEKVMQLVDYRLGFDLSPVLEKIDLVHRFCFAE